jgi:uncharacterized protein YdeI (YjbR/CyaY-like superfamily)
MATRRKVTRAGNRSTKAKKPDKAKSTLRRARHPMPAFVRRALTERGLLEAYQRRPPYQQNDYVGWISRAKRKETQQSRLDLMLAELARGNGYMKMEWWPSHGPRW